MFSSLKGWVGEKLTTFGMWLRLDEKTYRRIDDSILPSNNGTTQIDHVLVSIYGIFVIETKNMQGWIFGSENDATWCQSIYGHKNRFQNPLRQNHRHIECLAQFLGLERALFHSIVFFIGECESRRRCLRMSSVLGLVVTSRAFGIQHSGCLKLRKSRAGYGI